MKLYLPKLSDSSLSRQIKRLHIFGMIKRVPGTYRYYLTKLGRAATAACIHAMEFKYELRAKLKSKQTRGVAIFAKAFLGIPAQQAAKITRPLMPSAAPAVLLHSLHTQQ
ncbi:MAG: hypothetical protein WAW61_20760, partial [Methylococcaceae bacterium]